MDVHISAVRLSLYPHHDSLGVGPLLPILLHHHVLESFPYVGSSNPTNSLNPVIHNGKGLQVFHHHIHESLIQLSLLVHYDND